MSSLWPSPSGKWSKISFSDELTARRVHHEQDAVDHDSEADSADDEWMLQLAKDYDSSRRRHRRRTWTGYERRATVALFVFVASTLVLAFLLAYHSQLRLPTLFGRGKKPAQAGVCLSRACVRAATGMAALVDETVHPCHDFYAYACGGGLKQEAAGIAGKLAFNRIAQANSRLLAGLLQAPDLRVNGSEAVGKMADYYEACVDWGKIEARGAKPLHDLIAHVGSWAVTNRAWNPDAWNFGQALTHIHKLKSMPLFYMFVGPDDRDSSRNIIQIQQAGITLRDESYYKRNDSDKLLTGYKQFMESTGTLLAPGNKEHVVKQMTEVFEFEKKLANIYESMESLENSENTYNKMTIADLQQLAPSIPWMDYMNNIFTTPVSFSEPVIVYTPHYLKNMSELVTKTERRVLANYMTWHLIRPLLHLLSRPFRQQNVQFQVLEEGRRTDKNPVSECVKKTETLFGFVAGHLYVKARNGRLAKEQASEMLEAIKQTFSKNIIKIKWMDEQTKEKALEKLNAVINMIGYPKWVKDESQLNKFYKNLTVTKKSHFESYLNARRFYHDKMMSRRAKLVERTEWHLTPSEVNAYYSIPTNIMAFPLGILQKPFFEANWPKYLNFGALGVVMGHELTHGFDNKGRRFDKYGNLRNWWINGSLERFETRVKCLVDQYNNFTISENKVNGARTLAENIADNGGLKLAYEAYKENAKGVVGEDILPSFNLTQEQLFFLSFAQVWCSSGENSQNITTSSLTDKHSPGKIRVLATLRNSEYFSEAFNCPQGSPMNPKQKCHLW